VKCAASDGRTLAVPGRRPAAKPFASVESPHPVVSLRLREVRVWLRLAVQDVAGKLMCWATKIGHLETGARRGNPPDARDLCRLYRLADQSQADKLMNLAQLARQPARWAEYEDVFSPMPGLEQEARSMTCYSVVHVPAMLQTGDYARAVIKVVEHKMKPDVPDQRAGAAPHGGKLMDRVSPLGFRAACYKQLGSFEIMRAPLDRIHARIRGEKAIVQVPPSKDGNSASPSSHFYLEFGERRQHTSCSSRVLVNNRYYERLLAPILSLSGLVNVPYCVTGQVRTPVAAL